jgi:hypothetical protein
MKRMQKDPDMLEEYDFSKGVQGKYANRYAEGTNVVVIEPDIAEVLPDHYSVNQDPVTDKKIRMNTSTGRPLGNEGFIAELENKLY